MGGCFSGCRLINLRGLHCDPLLRAILNNLKLRIILSRPYCDRFSIKKNLPCEGETPGAAVLQSV